MRLILNFTFICLISERRRNVIRHIKREWVAITGTCMSKKSEFEFAMLHLRHHRKMRAFLATWGSACQDTQTGNRSKFATRWTPGWLCHSFVYLYLCTRKPTPFAKLKVSKGIMRSPHMSTLWTYVLRVYTIYLQIDCVVLSRSLSLKPVYFCIFVFLYTFPTPCCVLSGSTVSPPPPIIYLHLFHPSGEDLIHLFQRFLANFHHRTTFHHQSPPFSPIFNTKSWHLVQRFQESIFFLEIRI